MLPYRDSRLTIILLGTFFALAALYALYEARGQIFGPSIEIATYDSVVHDSFFQISGKALRISKLSMNGYDVSVTENGDFGEAYILASGYNRIVFDAKDTYGRTTSRTLEITYEPTSTPPTVGTHATATSSSEVPSTSRLAPKE